VVIDKITASEKLLNTFGNFITTIKNHDDSVYFWIQGGYLRRSIRDTLFEFDTLNESNLDQKYIDIDMFTTSFKDFEKISKILTKKLGLEELREWPGFRRFKFFNLNIELVKTPFKDMDFKDFNDFFETGGPQHTAWSYLYHMTAWSDIKTALYWVDFTNSAIALDSDFNLYYDKDFFNSINNNKLKFVSRDEKFLNVLIDKFCYNSNTKKLIQILFGMLILQRRYIYKFDLDTQPESHSDIKPRIFKFLDMGYSIEDDNFNENKKELNKLRKSIIPHLTTFDRNGWWQDTSFKGIINDELADFLHELSDTEYKKLFLTFRKIIKKLTEKSNMIENLNIKL